MSIKVSVRKNNKNYDFKCSPHDEIETLQASDDNRDQMKVTGSLSRDDLNCLMSPGESKKQPSLLSDDFVFTKKNKKPRQISDSDESCCSDYVCYSCLPTCHCLSHLSQCCCSCIHHGLVKSKKNILLSNDS